MAAKTFQCRLVTPTAAVLDEPVTYASVPMWDGLAGILPNRAPIVGKLGMGELRLDFPANDDRGQGGTRSYLVEDGFVQMVGNKLTILASKAIPVEEISQADAEAELAEAEARKAPLEHAAAESLRRDRDRARLKVRLARSARAIGKAI